MTLTSRQKNLMNLAKTKGFLTLEDFQAEFTSPISRKSNLERLLALKLIKSSVIIGKFDYIEVEEN